MKWFILLPMGHEGPYTLNQLTQLLEKKKIAKDVNVWAEGLPGPVLLRAALNEAEKKNIVEEEIVPDLPPVPEAEELPPIPVVQEDTPDLTPEDSGIPRAKTSTKARTWAFVGISVVLMLFFAFGSAVKNLETFSFERVPKMTMELHKRILEENAFENWGKKIFFKEYLSDDHTHIWLVTSGFQQCQVEASFHSIKDKLLSVNDEKVTFTAKGELKNHMVELSSFEFTTGNKIIPGLYEMDVKAHDCEWSGLVPLVMNKFQGPDKDYVARTKVVLFSKGAIEFNKILDKLVQKKLAEEMEKKSKEDLFWQTIQQKFETLQAVTLQVEQMFLDFLDQKPGQFQNALKPMIDQYTRKFGSFFTSFIVDNEKYFQDLKEGDSKKRNYELIVKLTTKKIGFESMKFIEDFQSKKNPTIKELEKYREGVKKVFNSLKNDINQKIIQVSEDRSH